MRGTHPENTASLTNFVGFPFTETGSPAEHAAVKGRAGGGDAETLEELTRAVRRGDEAAFGRFYDLYSLRLYKHLLALARGDEACAREVLQDVLVKLSKRVEVIEDEARLWGWLRQVARNCFIDHCRAGRRDPGFVSMEALSGELADAPVEDHLLAEALRKVMEGLPTDEQEVLRAAYVDERSLQNIADEMGTTYKAIESRLGRLRRKVKENLLKELRHERLH